MSEKYEIFSAAFSANSLRATGFKSTHYALAELIDNSVQSALEDKKSKNCNVEVIAIDKDQKLSKIISFFEFVTFNLLNIHTLGNTDLPRSHIFVRPSHESN